MAQRVVEKVLQGLANAGRIDRHRPRLDVKLDASARSTGPFVVQRHRLSYEVRDRYLLAIDGHAVSLEPGEDEKVFGQSHQAVGLLGGVPEGCFQLLGGSATRQRQVKLHLQHAQRCPELMARIVDEAMLTLQRLLKSIEHCV